MDEKELLQYIKRVIESEATELNLSNNNLTALPPQIGQLSNIPK